MFLEIIKFKITVLVSLTTGLGYILAADSLSFQLFYPVIGIFLLACSASALNHYQERDTDALMHRTSGRPIPSGRIQPAGVLIISFIIFMLGSIVLISGTNLLTLSIGYLTFIWYNGVYTPLKKITPWAIVPGSLVGALPPMAGWVAAGSSPLDSRILLVSLYFFIWQIPHFWLLLMLYSKDYERGGFPTLSSVFTDSQLKLVTFVWLVSTVFTAMLMPLFGIVSYTSSALILLLLSFWMIYNALKFLRSGTENKQVIRSFVRINLYTLMLITLLSADKITRLI
jgi:protoheme IX farnesyltransferase